MKILGFAASLRKDSLNRKLINQAFKILETSSQAPSVDHADFREFEIPIYNGDVEESSGIPSGVQALIQRIQAADALVIAAPEYNGGISGTFKNAIDWVSRSKPIAFSGKPILLLGASPGALGAVKGLMHTRVPLEAISAFVFPQTFGLARAHQGFDTNGNLIDDAIRKQLEELLHAYIKYAALLSSRN